MVALDSKSAQAADLFDPSKNLDLASLQVQPGRELLIARHSKRTQAQTQHTWTNTLCIGR